MTSRGNYYLLAGNAWVAAWNDHANGLYDAFTKNKCTRKPASSQLPTTTKTCLTAIAWYTGTYNSFSSD